MRKLCTDEVGWGVKMKKNEKNVSYKKTFFFTTPLALQFKYDL
jgi:hypothetical protein